MRAAGRRTRRAWLAVVLFAPTASAVTADDPALSAGSTLERALRGGEQHVYELPLTAGQYLDASLDPQGVTVNFRLLAPDGKTFEEELPGGTGAKSIEWIAAADGPHRLEVHSTAAATRQGRYRLEIR